MCYKGEIVRGKWKLLALHMYTNYLVLHIYMGRVKRIWYLSPMRAAKVQTSLRICAVSPEPLLLAHTSSASMTSYNLFSYYLSVSADRWESENVKRHKYIYIINVM